MTFLTCLRVTRRLAPYLDGALSGDRARAVAVHLRGCAGCGREAARLERLKALLGAAFRVDTDPDWCGFWGGVRGRILTEHREPLREAWRGRLQWVAGWFPRLALSGALVVLLLVGTAYWQRVPVEQLPPGIAVSAVETWHSNGSVMVFSSPEDEMTVIWIFGLEQPADQSEFGPGGVKGEWA